MSGSILGVSQQAQPTSARARRAKVKVMLSAVQSKQECITRQTVVSQCRQAASAGRQARQGRQGSIRDDASQHSA